MEGEIQWQPPHKLERPCICGSSASLALLWNCFGCFDYLMTQMRNTDYLASAMPSVDPNAMLAWVDSLPIYAQIGWGLGVWTGSSARSCC